MTRVPFHRITAALSLSPGLGFPSEHSVYPSVLDKRAVVHSHYAPQGRSALVTWIGPDQM
jgi:hypothetical protein